MGRRTYFEKAGQAERRPANRGPEPPPPAIAVYRRYACNANATDLGHPPEAHELNLRGVAAGGLDLTREELGHFAAEKELGFLADDDISRYWSSAP